VIAVALVGLLANLAMALLLKEGVRLSINLKGVFLHVIGDTFSAASANRRNFRVQIASCYLGRRFESGRTQKVYRARIGPELCSSPRIGVPKRSLVRERGRRRLPHFKFLDNIIVNDIGVSRIRSSNL